jgi:hypothetical protein
MKALSVSAAVVREEAGIDAALAERRQQLQKMLFRAADALNLGQVEHPHRVSSSR